LPFAINVSHTKSTPGNIDLKLNNAQRYRFNQLPARRAIKHRGFSQKTRFTILLKMFLRDKIERP
jgi:hypothetical protein|tara:strand:+ start:666 stop:860 length:195 start_codon:yes stop_codon:yes gene_type:complete